MFCKFPKCFFGNGISKPNFSMEYCICVSTETVLQVAKFYTVVKKNLKKLTFRTVVNIHSEEELQISFF